MKVLKGFALGLLGFLLFWSLTALGLAIMLNSTVLNADFVVSEINKVDISSLANQYINQAPPDQLPTEAKTSLTKTITKLEPQIKQQIGAAIYPTYDYVLGRSQNLDLALVLKNSFLKTEFLSATINEVDLTTLIKQFVDDQIGDIGAIPTPGNKPLMQYIDDAIAKSEPEIKQQINAAVPSIVDYLLGKSQSLNITISVKTMLDNLKDTVKPDFLSFPPPQYSGLSQAQLEQVFDQYFADLTQGVPETITLDEQTVGDVFGGIRDGIASGLTSAKQALDQARGYLSYFDIIFRGLIGLTILLIVGIILINRQVKASTRGIGIIFLIYGALEFVGILVAKNLAIPQLAQINIPANLQTLIPQFLDDIIRPLQIFSLTILIVGIVLIIISHVYKRRQTTTA